MASKQLTLDDAKKLIGGHPSVLLLWRLLDLDHELTGLGTLAFLREQWLGVEERWNSLRQCDPSDAPPGYEHLLEDEPDYRAVPVRVENMPAMIEGWQSRCAEAHLLLFLHLRSYKHGADTRVMSWSIELDAQLMRISDWVAPLLLLELEKHSIDSKSIEHGGRAHEKITTAANELLAEIRLFGLPENQVTGETAAMETIGTRAAIEPKQLAVLLLTTRPDLSVDHIAELAGCHKGTLYRWRDKDEIVARAIEIHTGSKKQPRRIVRGRKVDGQIEATDRQV